MSDEKTVKLSYTCDECDGQIILEVVKILGKVQIPYQVICPKCGFSYNTVADSDTETNKINISLSPSNVREGHFF